MLSQIKQPGYPSSVNFDAIQAKFVDLNFTFSRISWAQLLTVELYLQFEVNSEF